MGRSGSGTVSAKRDRDTLRERDADPENLFYGDEGYAKGGPRLRVLSSVGSTTADIVMRSRSCPTELTVGVLGEDWRAVVGEVSTP